MIVWDDIDKLTTSYTNGIKKLDGISANEKMNKSKTNYNSNGQMPIIFKNS